MTPERTKPFPWRCPACAKKAVQPAEVGYTARIKHDGRLHDVEVPALRCTRCESCGELVLGADSDEQIIRALRDKLRLLQPDEIRSQRESLGLTQTKLAERLGVAQETISRWESGLVIQSRANDNLMRLYFTQSDVRDALAERERELASAASNMNGSH
jgi:putative zinc finger/helix-turn-helix YgiT family protein